MEVDSYLLGITVIVGSALLTIGGLLLVRRKVEVHTLASGHEVAGNLLSVIGTMYAVLLGLIVVDAMSRFEQAQQNVQQEANCLGDIFLLSNRLAPAKKQEIQQLCQRYADLVLEDEWAAMDHGKVSLPTRSTGVELLKAVISIEPRNDTEQSLYQTMIQQATQFWDNRNFRTTTAVTGLPLIQWVVLIIGGAVTVVFTYFFGLENLKMQIVMTSMVTLSIALNLFLVLMFGYPFSGDLRVNPRGFKIDRAIFRNQHGEHTSETWVQ